LVLDVLEWWLSNDVSSRCVVTNKEVDCLRCDPISSIERFTSKFQSTTNPLCFCPNDLCPMTTWLFGTCIRIGPIFFFVFPQLHQ
jgi:hypothetical protein